MAKGKYGICPKCGEHILIRNITKVSDKNADFFDIENDQIEHEKEVQKILRDKNIEFGQKRKAVRNI